MKLLIFSDIHLEFQKDEGYEFFKAYENVDHDVLIVAGDLCDFPILKQSIRSLALNFNKIVHVNGNHECYGGSIDLTVAECREIGSKYGNFHYLEQEAVCIQDKWFHGCALWFPYETVNELDNYDHFVRLSKEERGMTDFRLIKNIREEVGDYNKNGAAYLRRCVGDGDVVVTHHLPSYDCVDPKYKGSPLNRFFVTPMEDLYATRSPALHVFGHTHESVDMTIGNTRLVCNPYGYKDHELNKNFQCPMVIEL